MPQSYFPVTPPTPGPHAPSHQHGGSDEVAVATPAANAIPKARADSILDPGWIPGQLSGEWIYKTTHAASDPGTGNLTANVPTNTELYISQTTNGGINATNVLSQLGLGDTITFQNETNPTQYFRFRVSAAPVDNGAWWTIAVQLTFTGGGGEPGNNDKILVQFTYGGGTLAGMTGLLSTAQTPLAHTHAAGDVISGQFVMARLASGTPDGTKFIRDDGTLAVPSGGGGGSNVGTATLDFGAFPGASDASVAVTGQAAIVSGSVVNAWLRPATTTDHTADEHLLETMRVVAGNIVAGTGFTIYGINTSQLNEPLVAGGNGRTSNTLIPTGDGGPRMGGKGTRLYGQWTVAWSWN